MREKLVGPTASEDARIGRGISVAGIIGRLGRPLKPDRKISVTLRLHRDVAERFKTGVGWQTRINALKKRVLPADRPRWTNAVD